MFGGVIKDGFFVFEPFDDYYCNRVCECVRLGWAMIVEGCLY